MQDEYYIGLLPMEAASRCSQKALWNHAFQKNNDEAGEVGDRDVGRKTQKRAHIGILFKKLIPMNQD